MCHSKLKNINKYTLLITLLVLFLSETMGYVSIYNSFGINKVLEIMNFWLYIMPFIFIFFIVRNFKYAYIALLMLSLYLLINDVGISSITTLFTMFFWKSFSLQPYLYRLSSWLIPLFSLIGVAIQIIEYKKLQDDDRTG
ncbi:hypothetical protein [Francisella philomiragia]|uniref:hypothetical protein n=2 Tax=Francisella philomiragia TaxID=28110 RepID=UPI001906E05E|nr:hypothetical protein [Francisella philomiragia]MBK2277941.1 hypothetical protein [Francisella philomiragia]MBK2288174.1 hypothetical protein [Francisella philomiragia]MBK2289756.1 hypothetical protein [Francisella philomiragia]MBK2307147.1 hypothetical protein [Francisella philomiragia]